jgi:hypothetical protein
MVADDPDMKIKLKTLHCEIINDRETLEKEEQNYQDLPVIAKITSQMVMNNYYKIKQDIEDLIETEIEILLNTPGKEGILFADESA